VGDLNGDLWWWGMREVWTCGDDKVGSGHGGWQHAGVAEMLVPWVGGLLPPQTWRAGWPGCILLIECTQMHNIYTIYIYIYIYIRKNKKEKNQKEKKPKTVTAF
jgi:hypothetical protein